ncbi:hypothetical protein MYX84_14895, partial [Acidobacteria bacterium AH-259-O06]|nr:hypothetical protein [Acidobacteria bacterium AH-259-O06]
YRRGAMIMNNDTLIDIIGWIGAAALLFAYALVSARRVEGNSTAYQLLNIGGSVFLIVNTIHYGAFPSAFVNIVWMGIAIYTIRKAITKALQGSG